MPSLPRLTCELRARPRRFSRPFRPAALLCLESRQLLTSLPSPVAIVQSLSATPDGGQGVTVSYQIGASSPGSVTPPITFGIYRSADGRLDANDLLVGTGTADSSLGSHTAMLTIAGGLTPNPDRPYVVVAAQPDAASHADATDTATLPSSSFRAYTIAVVVHGGDQNPNWASVPKWEGQLVAGLRAQGYDEVIPFNWVKVSDKPGYAAAQGTRLARQVLAAAQALPAGAPIDLHLIGHSEGAVVISQGLQHLEPEMTPGLKAGFIKVTLLDPHAANPDVPGQQYSVSHGPLGWLAKALIDHFQSRAHDPPVVFDARVNQVEVFYEHSTAAHGDASNYHAYNLWGQVPLRTPATYFDLTQDGVVHSGTYGVPVWYIRNVVPTLGNGAPEVAASVLTGALDPADAVIGQTTVSAVAQPRFEGHAAPGSTVRLLAAPASQPGDLSVVGRAVANASGSWSLTTRPLHDGRYRLLARSLSPRGTMSPRLPMVPTDPIGAFTVSTQG